MLARRDLLKAAAGLAALPLAGRAQPNWPSRAITYVVPLAPGGATDTSARLISERLSPRLNVPVVVENRAGAGGSIGAEYVARAPADGYTLLGGSISTHAINVSLYRKLGYHPLESFTPLAMIGMNPLLLVVPANSPYQSLAQMLDAARRAPGTLSFASAGPGTSQHMAGELLAFRTGTKLVHVPYKGSAPALQDVLGGQVNMMLDTAVACAPYVKSGKLRALATGYKVRLESFPDVPTVMESGVADFDVSSWLAVYARSGTEASIVSRLREEIGGVLRTPDMRERLRQLGTLPVDMDEAQMNRFLVAEIAKWKQVIDAAGINV